MAQNRPQFHLVWNPTGRIPLVKHATVVEAHQEAERLATANPGHEFFILKATHVSRMPAVLTECLQPPSHSNF